MKKQVAGQIRTLTVPPVFIAKMVSVHGPTLMVTPKHGAPPKSTQIQKPAAQ